VITPHTMVEPTLDDARHAQLRSYLIREVSPAADIAPTPRRQNHRRPLLATGVATVLAAAGLTIGAVFTAGPTGTPAAEAAVAIEHQDGWTTIRLLDVNADPDAVLAQLQSAGIDARIDTHDSLYTEPPDTGTETIVHIGDTAPVGVVSLAVVIPPELAPAVIPPSDAVPPPDDATDGTDPVGEVVEWYPGIREGEGWVSFRDDAGIEVVIVVTD
jgi:hypothetical protein